jgi:hypothetical protein
VLERIRRALQPGGVFMMKEPRLSSNLEDNIGNPFAPMAYAVSTPHCMTISLAEGGAGLGTPFGEQIARRLLAPIFLLIGPRGEVAPTTLGLTLVVSPGGLSFALLHAWPLWAAG